MRWNPKDAIRAGANTTPPPIITPKRNGGASRNSSIAPCNCCAPNRCSISAAIPVSTRALLPVQAPASSPGTPTLLHRTAIGERPGRPACPSFPWSRMWPGQLRQSDGCNAESLTLLERARQRFDCVMMLGILHHLLLADQIPMADVAALLASLTRRWSIVEWVPKTDVRYIDLCRGRDELYAHLDEDLFVEQFTRHFTILTREELSNGRVLFLFEKR